MVETSNNTITREDVFIELYKSVFPRFASFVSKRGGSFDSAKDVFQDALIIYYEKSRVKTISKKNAYLFGVARFLWFQKYRDESSFEPLHNSDLEIEDGEAPLPSQEKLLRFMEQAGQKCMDILRAFYYDKLSMDHLSQQFGFRSERSATVQKYKCLEKVRNEVKEKQLTYEDFFE